MLPKKAGLQTFLHSQAPSQEFSMAFMLRSHNGVHCCGTVGDSHSHSQLSAVKHTFTGDSFQNHDAKIQFFFEITSNLIEKNNCAQYFSHSEKDTIHQGKVLSCQYTLIFLASDYRF